MKKCILPLFLVLLLLSACGGEAGENDPVRTAPSSGSPVLQSPDPAEVLGQSEDGLVPDCIGTPLLLPCRVVDGAKSGELLLATLPEEGAMYEGVFRLDVSGELPLWKDPAPGPDGLTQCTQASPNELEDGMLLWVVCDNVTQQEFPGTFSGLRSVEIVAEECEYFDLCGFYLQVLDDLWQVDPGLNSDISTVIVDLSQAPGGLTEQERTALVWQFGAFHGVTALDVSEPSVMERLEGAGYYAECGSEIRGLEDACLFTVRAHEGEEAEDSSPSVLRFDASKWRGPLAAYCFYDCTAVWLESGPCTGYEIGAEMIS